MYSLHDDDSTSLSDLTFYIFWNIIEIVSIDKGVNQFCYFAWWPVLQQRYAEIIKQTPL